MADEKPLGKCTVKELREIAHEGEGIQGTSVMKKAELLNAIREARGISITKTRETTIDTIVDLKRRIKELKAKKEELQKQVDRIGVTRLKRKISKLKKKTRKMARSMAS